MATITRIFEFDSAHRVMNEKVKCFNLHGHRFKVELTFEYFTKGSLGYAIDFKEIKRIAGTWLDENFDHASILNPNDEQLIMLCRNYEWKLYIMGLGNFGDINPSAENLASEIFYSLSVIFKTSFKGVISLKNVRLYETPNCWVDTDKADYVATPQRVKELTEWATKMGVFNYDVRDNAKA